MLTLLSRLKTLAIKLATQGPVKTLPTPRQIQLLHHGLPILKTTSAIYVWEQAYYPHIYLPKSTLDSALSSHPHLTLTPGPQIHHPETKALLATTLTLQVGPHPPIPNILLFAADLPSTSTPSPGPQTPISDPLLPPTDTTREPPSTLTNLLKIPFEGVSTWLEETLPIFVHPKDPFKRIEILPSTRHIKISLPFETSSSGDDREGDVVVAETTSSMHLYETGLPARYYLPLTSVKDLSWLRKTETRTRCPYKGTAEYYSVVVSEEGGKEREWKDVVWYYPVCFPECAAVMGLVCFYNEKVDIWIDGEKQARAVTHMAKGPNAKPPTA